jgi:hypothetical protein
MDAYRFEVESWRAVGAETKQAERRRPEGRIRSRSDLDDECILHESA